MLIALFRHHATAGSTVEKTELHEIWLVNLFHRSIFFRKRGGNGFKTDRAAFELINQYGKNIAVDLVETKFVDFQKREGFFNGFQI